MSFGVGWNLEARIQNNLLAQEVIRRLVGEIQSYSCVIRRSDADGRVVKLQLVNPTDGHKDAGSLGHVC